MKARRRIRTKRTQAGIALLISIFILLLISVVAIALIVSSGTESALAGNYRSSTGVYYAAMAGLEEARTRLLPKNPSYFRTTSPGFLPSVGTPLAVGSPIYVINPLSSETVAPWDPTSTYPDKEYNPEFASSGFTLPSSPPWTNSVWNTAPLNTLSFPGPLYKWVRINAVSEKSLNLDVYPYDGSYDSTTPVFYDGTRLNVQNTGAQVLEITSFAMLPNGTQKILQYQVAATKGLFFGAAFNLAGTNVTFDYPNYGGPPNGSYPFKVDGTDVDCNGVPTANPSVLGLGWTDSHQPSYGSNGPFIAPSSSYLGSGPNPSIGNDSATLSPTFQTPAQVEAFIQQYESDPSTVSVSGPATNGTLTSAAPSVSVSPVTILVNGDLTLSGPFTGNGMLIVTGNFQYTGGTRWNGIVLVIGMGTAKEVASGDNGGKFRGAVVLAKSRHSDGTVISGTNLGSSNIDFNNPNGSSFYYSTCWIDAALPPSGYKVLSFHEISQ